MPLITAGTSATVTLAANQFATIAPDAGETAVVNIRRGGALIANTFVSSARAIGPYQNGDVMTITAVRGDVDYELGTVSVPSPGGTVDAASVQAALSSDQPGGRAALGLGSAATQAASAFATAAQGTDAREWVADTVGQAEAEAGTATTRRAWTAQRVRQAAVAASGSMRDVADLAALLAIASPTAGMRARTVAPVIGTLAQGGIPYVRWVHDGTTWRLDGPQSLLVDYSADVGVTGTSAQLLKQRTAAVGLFPLLRGWGAKIHYVKSGATDSATFFARLGPLGTMADVQLFAISLSAGNRNITVEHRRQVVNATTLRGDYVNPTFGYVGTQTNVAPYPQDLSVSNMATNAMILTAAMTMGGSADAPTVAAMIVEGW